MMLHLVNMNTVAYDIFALQRNSSTNIIRQDKEDEMGRACCTHGNERTAYRVLMGKPAGKRPLGRTRRSWENCIKMGLREQGWGDMGWIDLAQDVN
jgi:hypothetical protein